MCRRSAARPKWSSSANATKYSTRRRSSRSIGRAYRSVASPSWTYRPIALILAGGPTSRRHQSGLAGRRQVSAATRSEPATAVFARRVKPGREAEYEQLAHQMIDASKAFTGQLGATMLHDAGSPDYTLVYSFTEPPELQAWLDSGQRQALLTRADQIAEQHWQL